MTRVSLEEQYNNKDVITQILKMRDDIARIAANAAGIQDITMTTTATGWAITFTLTTGNIYTFPLDATGYITDEELATALGDYYTKEEVDDALAGYYDKDETDSLLSGKANDSDVVKLTGDQSIGGVKTFSNEARVPSTPTSYQDAVNAAYVNNANSTVNNIVHKDGSAETVTSEKTFTKTIFSTRDSTDQYQLINILKNTNIPTRDTVPANEMIFFDGLVGNTDDLSVATINRCIGPTQRYFVFALRNMRNGQVTPFGVYSSSSEDYATSPYRTVDPSSAAYDTDIVTVGTLKALKNAGWFS